MKQPNVQYISNDTGEITAVVVPIEYWREIASEQETQYLLGSPAMKKRLMEARNREEGISLEEVSDQLGV